MRGLFRLFESFAESPISLFRFIPYLLLVIFSFVIARYCYKHFKGKESNLIMVGAVMKLVHFFVSQISYINIAEMGMSNMEIYFNILMLFNVLANFLFLYGIYLLFKTLYNRQEFSSDTRSSGNGDSSYVNRS